METHKFTDGERGHSGFEDTRGHMLAPPLTSAETKTDSGPPSCENANMATTIVPGLMLFAIGLIGAPATALTTLSVLLGFGWLPVFLGLAKRVFKTSPPKAVPRQTAWPDIVLLLPLYNEANMLGQISEMLNALDYPTDRLDCMILLEADDKETLLAAMRIKWPGFVRIVSVPDGAPRTKARACNYGLRHSTGDIVVIFDAEDMPHPQQLREAATRFHAADKNLGCLQAPLQILPQHGSWLQAQFALEYSVLFGFILPNLSAAMSCLPLGGSSNYFRRSVLEKVGGWDAHNLTEDADLALRLAGYGYRIETLCHGTLENAPHRVRIWHSQRTRWQSGHIQLLHAYFIWTLRFGLGHLNGFKWRLAMLACVGVLTVRLLSGPLHLISLCVLLSQIFINNHPALVTGALVFYGLYAIPLFAYSRADCVFDRIGLVLTHPFYWLMTVPPQVNALRRMASGRVDWLKSPHQTYDPHQ